MTIRKAVRNDIDGIMNLLYQVARVHHEGRPDLFKPNASKYLPCDLELIINDDNTPIYVAVDENNNVLGHAFCMFKRSNDTRVLEERLSMYIDDICIDEKHRCNHIGTALCNEVIRIAKSKGCYNITLNVWSLNKSAFEFYKALGFKNQKITMEMIL